MGVSRQQTAKRSYFHFCSNFFADEARMCAEKTSSTMLNFHLCKSSKDDSYLKRMDCRLLNLHINLFLTIHHFLNGSYLLHMTQNMLNVEV